MSEIDTLDAGAASAKEAGADQAPSGSPGLTATDIELLRLLAQGVPMDTIARQLYTSCRTNRRRIRALCEKLGVGTPIEAVAWAARRGYI
ncbi:MAG: helix-turn-helix transcriptional regulator [Catenulispora sp.]|nr:helix-turn-helix transcriptional regulator [Catenulispora sp.]